MKKLLTIFCFIISIQFALAQNLQTVAVKGTEVILPNYDNLIKILRMPGSTFLTTMATFGYVQDGGQNEYVTQDSDEIYSVTKDDKLVEINCQDSKYPQAAKDDFIARFPRASHELRDNGIEYYYFDLRDGSGVLHFSISFDIKKGTRGSVKLIDAN